MTQRCHCNGYYVLGNFHKRHLLLSESVHPCDRCNPWSLLRFLLVEGCTLRSLGTDPFYGVQGKFFEDQPRITRMSTNNGSRFGVRH